MTGTRCIKVNGKEHWVEEIFAISYERLCEVADIDPSLVPQITYVTGLMNAGIIEPGEFAPIKRYVVFNVVLDKK